MNDVLTQEHIDFYQENGFVQINDVLTAGEVAELAQNMEEAMQEESSASRSHYNSKDGAYYRVLNQKVNSWRDHGGMAKFSCSGHLAEMARRLTGASGIRMFHDHILWKMPGDSKPTPWHQDMPYWPMEQPLSLSIWLTVDDVNEENGCMMFVPRSQAAGKLKAISLVEPEDIFEYAKDTDAGKERPIIARMRAGSCTFHSGLTFHYAHANRTDTPRRVLAIIFMPDGTVYTGKRHVVTDGVGLEEGKPFRGGLFPKLA
jgi:ectoine hydroxylase-related dioxygenase (phytanoyl-CoA dioxygenase family)